MRVASAVTHGHASGRALAVCRAVRGICTRHFTRGYFIHVGRIPLADSLLGVPALLHGHTEDAAERQVPTMVPTPRTRWIRAYGFNEEVGESDLT